MYIEVQSHFGLSKAYTLIDSSLEEFIMENESFKNNSLDVNKLFDLFANHYGDKIELKLEGYDKLINAIANKGMINVTLENKNCKIYLNVTNIRLVKEWK